MIHLYNEKSPQIKVDYYFDIIKYFTVKLLKLTEVSTNKSKFQMNWMKMENILSNVKEKLFKKFTLHKFFKAWNRIKLAPYLFL